MSGLIDDRSQAARILRMLEANGLEWTSARDLSDVSLQYCARLYSLRHVGHKIENKVVTRDGTRFGYYRLAPKPKPVSRPQLQTERQRSLFDAAELVTRYRDPEEQFR